MTMQLLSASQVSPEIPINENFESLDHQAVYGKRHPVTTGLTWGYWGGRWGGFSIADGALTLTNAATSYIVVLRSSGAISVSTTSTNWNNTGTYARVYQLTTAGSVVTAVEDHRAGPSGVHGSASGSAGISINSQSTAYTLVIGDANGAILHPSSDTTARTFTIPANSSVAFGIGTAVTFINQNAAGVVTIAITTDTMRLAVTGATGSLTLAANGIATAVKLTSTEWLISGTGLA